MKRKTIKTSWEKKDLAKVFTAMCRYNLTNEDSLSVEGFNKENDPEIHVTIGYENERALIGFGIWLGRDGL